MGLWGVGMAWGWGHDPQREAGLVLGPAFNVWPGKRQVLDLGSKKAL